MLRVVVNAENPETDIMAKAGKILRDGGLVAFPTETVYGLGADALNPDAVAKVYKAKGRPSDNPLIWHGNRAEDFALDAEFNDPAHKLAKAFWPGPLTLILKKRGLGARRGVGQSPMALTLAIRVPSHPVARALIKASGLLVAAPSANISGRPSPTRAEHVAHDFRDGQNGIDMLIDGGAVQEGLESTVVDLHTGVPRLLRPGVITLEMLESVLGQVEYYSTKGDEAPISPGMKYRHYAPETPLVLLVGSPEAVTAKIGDSAGVLRTYGESPEEVAKVLFDRLRELDGEGHQVIYAEGVQEEGVGLAVMNRLRKAAHEVIYLE